MAKSNSGDWVITSFSSLLIDPDYYLDYLVLRHNHRFKLSLLKPFDTYWAWVGLGSSVFAKVTISPSLKKLPPWRTMLASPSSGSSKTTRST